MTLVTALMVVGGALVGALVVVIMMLVRIADALERLAGKE